jgi:hypothetical protein
LILSLEMENIAINLGEHLVVIWKFLNTEIILLQW